jgi:hypothetical protein
VRSIFFAGLLCLCAIPLAFAGVPAIQEPIVQRQPNDNPFARGTKEFQELAGGFRFFQFHNTNNDYPSIDYVIDTLRLGVMLNDPHGSGLFAGNFEFLGEVFGGAIVVGPGDAIAGGTLIFRYNFIQPSARFVPYFQLGVGGVYTDIDETKSFGQVSLPVEFNLQGTAGLRYLLNDRWSLVGEFGYRHISNAGLHSPNVGIDSLGGNVGIGFSF